MIAAKEALQRLQKGNQRFVSNYSNQGADLSQDRRSQLIDSQEPFAILLGCSDSRAPAEIIFDQGLGDLFVIRVAGNIVAPSQIGSIEFAAEQFGTRLVVVLGHTQCGAVKATLNELDRPHTNRSPNLNAIVERIEPAVSALLKSDLPPEELLGRAVRENVRASMNRLREGSPILENLLQNDGLLIVGAEYSLETGVVDFFEKAVA